MSRMWHPAGLRARTAISIAQAAALLSGHRSLKMDFFPGSSPPLLLQSAALPLLLQHSSVHTDVQAVLRLCSTCKAMRAAVLQNCKGLLDVTYQLESQQHAQFAVWVTQCGQLAGSLCCELADAPLRRPAVDAKTEEDMMIRLALAEQVIAAALIQLQQQQGQQGGLQLHTLVWHCTGRTNAAEMLLQVLPATKLLQLGLRQKEALFGEPPIVKGVSAGSIAALTQLQSLSVTAAIDVQQLQQALPALTALTSLYIITAGSRECSKEELALLQQQLPVQLKELTLEVELARRVQPQPLQLSHLTSLTALETLQVEEDSLLPLQLLQLQCSSCRSMQPLLACRKLQCIHMLCSRAGADELGQLTRLTGLTYLSLRYAEHIYLGMADAAAPAWPSLAHALRDIQIIGIEPAGLRSSTFQQLRHLHGLRQLSVQVTDDHDGNAVALPVTPGQCAEVLAGLTALRTLELSMDPGRHLLLHEHLGEAEAADAAPAAGVEVPAAAVEAADAAPAAGVEVPAAAAEAADAAPVAGEEVAAAAVEAADAALADNAEVPAAAEEPADAEPADNADVPPAAEEPADAELADNAEVPAAAAPLQAVGGVAPGFVDAQVFHEQMHALGAGAADMFAQLQAAFAAAAVDHAAGAAAAAADPAHPAGGAPLPPPAVQPAGQQQQQQEAVAGAHAFAVIQAAGLVGQGAQHLLQLLQQGQGQQPPPQQQQQQQQQQVQMMPNLPGPSPNMLPVTHVIAQLPHLDSLELKGSGLSLETVKPLTSLTRLTRLTVFGCDFDEAAFNSLALSLTGLQRLSIGGSELVGDASLVVVARVLQQLTELNLRSCSRVTDRGVLQLTSLQRMKLLWAEGTSVSQQVVARVLRGATRSAG